MKLIQTKDYLLLIDKEAEIEANELVIDSYNNICPFADLSFLGLGYDRTTIHKIIAYYPLTKEIKELDLPLLPNPFKDDKYIKDLGQQRWGNVHRTGVLGFIEGYKAAQSKQFSLEDMIAFSEYVGNYYADIHKPVIPTEELLNNFIQSLSTQQLPKEFIPEKEDVVIGHNGMRKEFGWKYKTIINSKSKQELVGTYKY